jgi:hypothetical protein
VAAFLAWLDREDKRCDSATQSRDRQAEDGLIELGRLLRWRGREYELPPQTWHLLQFFGERAIVAEGDLEDAVWGGVDATTAMIKQAVRRANQALEKADVGWRLVRKDGQIRKKRVRTSSDNSVTRLVTLRSP